MSNLAMLRYSGSLRAVVTNFIRQSRLISTSKKNSETACVVDNVEKIEKQETTCKVKKNWVSYGYDAEDETTDRNAMNMTVFGSVTLVMVFGGFFLAYLPDLKMRNWAQREAFLEIRRREAKGLPVIDRNLVDPQKIVLPSDEELGDTEIII